jgi:hypothetical protein
MKKLSILAFCLFIGIQVNAQNLKHFLGDYEVSNAPIEKIIITVENDKLYGNAVGQGKAELKPTKTSDSYEIVGFNGEVKFVRNDKKKVTSLLLSLNGQELNGKRLTPPLTDYEGTFNIADGPVSSMKLSVEDGIVMVDIPEIGKGPIKETSIIDQFYDDTYNSEIIFSRDEKNEVNGVHINAQGMTLEGTREASANPFIGHYKFEDAQISKLEISEKENGDLYGKANEGEGILKKTSNPNLFKIIDYDGEAVFERNADGTVKGIIVKIQGEEMKGSKGE